MVALDVPAFATSSRSRRRPPSVQHEQRQAAAGQHGLGLRAEQELAERAAAVRDHHDHVAAEHQVGRAGRHPDRVLDRIRVYNGFQDIFDRQTVQQAPVSL